MIEALAHSALNDVRQRDDAKRAPVFRHQEWRTPAIGNLPYALLDFQWHHLPTLSHVFRNGCRSGLANWAAVKVDPGHARLCGEGNKEWAQVTHLSSAQTILF